MFRAWGLAATVTAVCGGVAAAQAPTGYGSPSGCAGKPSGAEPYVFYDGKKLVAANMTCTLTPLPNSRATAECNGPQGQSTEIYTLVVTATSVQIFRENGTRLLGLPVCL